MTLNEIPQDRTKLRPILLMCPNHRTGVAGLLLIRLLGPAVRGGFRRCGFEDLLENHHCRAEVVPVGSDDDGVSEKVDF